MSEKIERAEALLLGADDYIIKPFSLEDLLKMVKAWILSGSTRRSNFAHMEESSVGAIFQVAAC